LDTPSYFMDTCRGREGKEDLCFLDLGTTQKPFISIGPLVLY